jgi:putative SOS response-associated peptidase YedK
MCGRFVQAADPSVYATFFGVAEVVTEALQPSYNVAPTDAVYAVAEHDGVRQLGSFRWGLLPFWAKDRKMAARNINARSETVATKASFRESFARRRCLVPADGFYEWQQLERGKLPHYITSQDGHPLALAGLWSSWRDPESDERVATCTILTGAPTEFMRPIHDRMPVILPAPTWDRWLDPTLHETDELHRVLAAADPHLRAHPVSTLVNKVSNNVPELIHPLDTPVAEQTVLGLE